MPLKEESMQFDDIITGNALDFSLSGLKTESLIRTGRLAVVTGEILLGAMGEISGQKLQRIKANLIGWLSQA